MDDQSFNLRLVSGDEAAFDTFFSAHWKPLVRTIVRLIGPHNQDEAEDLAQKAFITLARLRWELDPNQSIRAWLYRVALNSAKNQLRTWGRERLRLGRFRAEHSEHEVSDDPEESESIGQLLAAIDQLPEQHRAILILVHGEGLPLAEVAQICELTLPATRQRLHRARNALRKLVGQTERSAKA